MIEFLKVGFSYSESLEKKKSLFQDLDFSINKGEHLVLCGPNGSGKTSMALLAKGILSPSSGHIYYDGQDVTSMGINPHIGYLFSNPENQAVSPVVEDDVAFGPENQGFNPEEIKDKVEEALMITGSTHLKDSLTHHLSGGELQKVNISGLLSTNVDCILLDEALSLVESGVKRELLHLLVRLNRVEGITLIHITHDIYEILSANRVAVLNEGSIIYDGDPMLLMQDEKLLEILGFNNSDVATMINGVIKELGLTGSDCKNMECLVDKILDLKRAAITY